MSWLVLLFGGAWKKLTSLPLWEIALIAALLFAGLQTLRLKSEQRHARKVETQLSKCTAGREADRQAYVKAQADAAAKNKAQVQRIEQQQQKVTDDVEARYRADHARLLAGGVQPANPAPASPTSKPGASTPGATPGGPDGQAVPLSGPELLRAQETELQLNALIDWVLQQSQIDPNTGAAH